MAILMVDVPLNEEVEKAELLDDFIPKEIYVDRDYRGHNYESPAKTHLARQGMRKVEPSLRQWLKPRWVIEPVIGRMKNDGQLGRNNLLGQESEWINAILCCSRHNIRKLLRAFSFVSFLATSQSSFSAGKWIKIYLFLKQSREK